MKKISILFFAAFAVLLIACGGENSQLSPSGYKYVKHTNATGAAPNIGDYGYVNISVYQDDSLINSTYRMGRTVPIVVPDLSTIPPDQKVVGKANPVADVLALMKVGDSISVEIPIDSTMRQNPALAKAKRLTYGIVLMDVKTKDQYDQAQIEERKAAEEKAGVFKEQEAAIATQLGGIVKDYTAGKNKDKIKTTASGLKYMILEEGTGKKAEAGKTVDVMYYGMLPNGEEFDNAYKRGQPFSFPLGQGQVIKGWDEGIALLNEGTKAVLFVPSSLGYGDQGTGKIPANSELVFYVELMKVN
jgi:FKBP-type peptidyl-prolyl cis-trans isomerase FkpA